MSSSLISKNIDKFFYRSLLCYLSKSLHMLYVKLTLSGYFLLSQIHLPNRGRSLLPLTFATPVKSAASWTSTLRMPPWTKVRSAHSCWLKTGASAVDVVVRQHWHTNVWECIHVQIYFIYTPTSAPANRFFSEIVHKSLSACDMDELGFLYGVSAIVTSSISAIINPSSISAFAACSCCWNNEHPLHVLFQLTTPVTTGPGCPWLLMKLLSPETSRTDFQLIRL